MKLFRKVAFSLVSVALLFPVAGRAEELADRITYVIGSNAGGGYDRYGRLIARYLEKHLPVRSVTPVNRAVAGGKLAVRDVINGPSNASEIMIFNTGQIFSELTVPDTGLANAKWIGKAAAEARVLVVHPKTGIESFEELRKKSESLTFVASSFGNAGHLQTSMINDAFGLKLKVVPGFGGGERRASMAKGEADGMIASESNISPLVEAGHAVPIMMFGTPTDPALTNVPRATDLAETEDEILVTTVIESFSLLGRPTIAPAATDPEVLDTLREAFVAVMTDPEFLAEAEAQGLPIDWLPGPETEALAMQLLADNPRLAEMINAILSR